MKTKADRISSLAETFGAYLEQEQKACLELIALLIESAGAPQRTTSQQVLQLTALLKKLEERVSLLGEMARGNFLSKIKRESDELKRTLSDGRAASVLTSIIKTQPTSLKLMCESLLDRLIEATGAERGFILFYIPESTEAEVITARNFQTRNLSLEEYSFSRSLLKQVFERGEPLVLDDASRDPILSSEDSVRKLALKSVLAAPLKQDDRTLGALYLENNKLSRIFDQADAELAETAAQFAVFYLNNARMLPVVLERHARIFFDERKASKEIIGQDPKIVALLDTIRRIANSQATVLIEGETGTGKELVARALHYQSARCDRPFVAINCAAIPEDLLESELFGHEKGAFTGATERYVGRIEQGDRGTIFLDEISELAYPLQAKLLRFLQSNEFNRLGGKDTIRVDVRIVAATSKDLEKLSAERSFHEALFYRLNVIPVRVPALRDRPGDLPLLASHFVQKFGAIYNRRVRVDEEVYELLKNYSFPGNVRELENLIHRLIALAEDEVIRVGDLPAKLRQAVPHRISLEKDPLYEALHVQPDNLEGLAKQRKQVRQILAERERCLVERAVRDTAGNHTEAARLLGVHRSTLHKMMRRSERSKR